jgi:hypothetical protein
VIRRSSPGRLSALILTGLAAAAAVGLAALITSLGAAPAYAVEGPVGFVRLAHLSPDTPKVDVYLSKVGDASFQEQVFEHVGYGVMSKYLTLPVGTYAVAMRKEGDPASTPPVLTTQVTVADGGAYTIAGVGRFAGLGLKVYEDDLDRPTDGTAKVRVIQASVAKPVLDVGLDNGTPVARSISFASTTPYQSVKSGSWTLQITPSGTAATTRLSCQLQGGSVYSLLILDSPSGLRLQLLADARGGAQVPDGGVATGGGGMSTPYRLTVIGAGMLLLAGLVGLALRLRRARAGRP